MSEVKVKVKRMKLSALRPAEYNPRTISDEAFEGLGSSIDRFGMLSHIVWNKRTGNIVGGHQRYRHLMRVGETETDVVVVDLDDNEEVALNITLNNRNVRGDFSKDVMEQLRVSEAQIGSAFKQLGLLDLFEQLRKRGFDKKKKEPPQQTTPAPSGGREGEDDSGDDSGPPPTGEGMETKPEAFITCPKCRSQWRMKNNEVVFNSVIGQGNPVGEKKDAPQTVEN